MDQSSKNCIRTRRHLAALLAGSTALCFIPFAASAQGASPPQGASSVSEEAVGDIIVTAQRREQSLQDVPISINVATGDALRETQVTALNDLANRLPGVRINTGTSADSINIRGVGSGFNPGFEQAVGLFLDGVYVSRSQLTRAGFLDIERIEVLKGPQSTYFGANTIAGALSVVTRKPTQRFEGYASALYAPSDGEFDMQAAVGGPLTEKLSARVAARFSGMDGYVYNARANADGPHNRDFQARGSLRLEESNDLDVTLRVDYARYRDKRVELQELINCPPPPGSPYGNGGAPCVALIARGDQDNVVNYRTATGNSRFNLEVINPALVAALTLGDHTLTSQTSYFRHELYRAVTSGPILAAPTVNRPSGIASSQPETFRSFSQELRLESGKGNLIDYMVGLYYDDVHLDTAVNTGFFLADFAAATGGIIPAGTPIAQEVSGVQDQSNRSVFAAATINLTSAFRINLGGRYSSIKKETHRSVRTGVGDNEGVLISEFTPAQAAAFTSGRLPGDYPSPRRTDSKFMPSANVQYDVTPDVMLYASYATGFKAGGYNIGQNLETFGPEEVESFEAGIKATWFDRLLTTNVTVFTSNYSDLQESTIVIDPRTNLPTTTIANVAEARSRGVDLEIGLRPMPGLNLAANVGYLDAKYLNYPRAGCTQLQTLAVGRGCFQDLSGKTKAYAPKWSGSISANYTFRIGDGLQAKLGGWLYFTSGFYQTASIDPLLYQPGYAKLDLRASLGEVGDGWELAIIAKNVTDKTTASFRGYMPTSSAVNVTPERPRSIAAQASLKF